MQVRRVVHLDCLYESILAQSVPFRMKTTYLRLLFNGFIQSVEYVQSLRLYEDDQFLVIMRHVILYDIEHYYLYYKGLIHRIIEDENDPD